MKISNVQLKIDNESAVLTADCRIRRFGVDRVYFKFDKKYLDFIAVDASPFAAALLIPSMKLGEDLIIEGNISEQLYKGTGGGIIKIFSSWNIGLKPISIISKKLEKDSFNSDQTASFFSGGVDSFYTYLKNKKTGKAKIKYFILANGYDIDLRNSELWKNTCQMIENIAKGENIEVIKVESNIHDIIEPIIEWDYTHGGCLAALGLCLRKKMKNVLIASSDLKNTLIDPQAFDELIPWGSHPETDHFWSTETLFFSHDGADTSRLEKIKFISDSSLALKNLRVCYKNKKNELNCGVCEKCLRTMIALRIAGVLEKAETFPHKINREMVRKINIKKSVAMVHKDNLIALEKMKIEDDLQEIIREKLKNVSSLEPHRSFLNEIIKAVRFIDYFYNQDRLRKLKNFLLG